MNLLLFAGTSEGRTLAGYLGEKGISCHICVATQYGGELIEEETACHHVHTGRMDAQQMAELMREAQITDVVDATHPYAVEVTENIREAAALTGCRYIRLLREQSGTGEADCVIVDSVSEAAAFLSGQPGNILAATGSKDLSAYTVIPAYEKRVFARVLSTKESVETATSLGFKGKNLICMQGPFSEELNTAMLRSVNAAWLVTKESGRAGGFPEKAAAAKKAGAGLVVVGRPPQVEEGYSPGEVMQLLGLPLDDGQPAAGPARRRICLVGIGMGDPGNMTIEARKACEEADILIGAGRMLETAADLHKPVLNAYAAQDICDYLALHPEYRTAAILLSGDVGFYSAAGKLLAAFDHDDVEIEVYCGISSVVYLCGKLRTAWEDVKLVSLHGRTQNLIAAVRENRKVFAIVGRQESFRDMCAQLARYGLGDVTVHAGCRLSYPDEKIISGTAEELAKAKTGDLTAVLLVNEEAFSSTTHGLPDSAFTRGNVPMTKEEIRSISLSKLRLQADSVIYDVGAGTGSVSVEMALRSPDGMVYAIEKKEEAAQLIMKNALNLMASNVQVVRGLAPEAMEELPAPTHAFIGGSSGNLKEILLSLLRKNPRVRIVVNAISLETVSEMMGCLKELPLGDTDIAAVFVAKSRELGAYHMMTALNPVYVISCSGVTDQDER